LFPPPSQANPQLTRQLDAVVLRGLAEDPKNRFKSVQEFQKAFDQALSAPPKKAKTLAVVLVGLLVTLLAFVGLKWIIGPGSKRDLPIAPKPALVKSVAIRDGANTVKPRIAGKPSAQPAKAAPAQSPEFRRLVELRAYTIWVKRGSPKGRAGDLVRDKNWSEAERQILNEVEKRAFKIWVQQGRPKAAAGEAVREKNMRAAETQLLKETEEELRRHPIG
jgi:hypothetical protein